MLRLLDRRADGFRLYQVTAIDDLDLNAFLPMAARAWQRDYPAQPRIDIDDAFLRKLAQDAWWVAVLAVADDGSPVGFEIALERTVRVGDRALRAYYASIFTVSADHRRQGLGRWVLEGINRLVFEEHGGELILSTLQEGHAGSPVVQSTFDRIPGWGVERFHRSAIWSRRLDRDPLAPPPSALAFVRLEMAGDRPESDLRARGGASGAAVPDAAAIDSLVRSEFETSFALSGSLAAQYLNRDNPDSGIFLYDLGPGRTGLAAWNLVPMIRDQRRLSPIGQLQLLLVPGRASTDVEAVVRHVAGYLADRGCFAMTLLDMGVVPRAVLERLGFVATGAQIAFAARGPLSTIEAFAGLRPPFFLDFT